MIDPLIALLVIILEIEIVDYLDAGMFLSVPLLVLVLALFVVLLFTIFILPTGHLEVLIIDL